MYSHITIGANDVERAGTFYDAVMETLGYVRFFTADGALGYGKPADQQLWILTPFDGKPATAGNGTHIALLAQTRAAVDAFHAAALGNGGSDEGAPGLRPQYHEHYYGAYVRDPEGNKLQAVCHRPE